MDYHLFQVDVGGKIVSLTPTEFKLLRHLMENPGQTFSSEQLLDEVWKYPPGVGSLDVVRMYVKRLRDKMEADPRKPEYIVTIPGHGYRVPQSEQIDSYSVSDSYDRHGRDIERYGSHPVQRGQASIDGAYTDIIEALQSVTLTCQATLSTMTYLAEEVSMAAGHHSVPESGSRSSVLSVNGTVDRNGTRGTIAERSALKPHNVPASSKRRSSSSPTAEDIAIAAQSLSGLASDLQDTLSQLKEDWSSVPIKNLSVGSMS